MGKKIIWLIVSSVIGAVVTTCWNAFNADCKELTICEERSVNIFDTFDDEFIIYTKDSLNLEGYRIIEYSITNTGNTTIVGTGVQSDLLVDGNTLRIAHDSVIVKIYDKGEYVNLLDNQITFKQIRPNEKITLICVSNQNTENHLINISDRDIKDVNIIYTKRNSKLTTFEKTTSTNRWINAICFLINLILVLAIISPNT